MVLLEHRKGWSKDNYIPLGEGIWGEGLCVFKEIKFLFCFSRKGNYLKLACLRRMLIMDLK